MTFGVTVKFVRRRKNIMEQRAVIKFHAKLGTSATKTFQMMQQVFGEACLSRHMVFEWHKRFCEGRESLEDDRRTPPPRSVHTAENIAKVRDYIANDRSATVRMMEEDLGINRETIRLIIKEDLGKTKVCSRFVPHHLTDDQKRGRVRHCRDLVSTAENNRNFLKSIVTGDETWCFQYDPETKRQSAEWKSSGSPKSKKVRQAPSKIKTMLIVFYDSIGIVHHEFVPTGQTVNAAFYLEVLRRLLARIRRIRPQYRDPESWCLLHDNAPSHTAILIRQFFYQKQCLCA